MGYGAQARRVEARGGKGLTMADIYKIGLMGWFERGIQGIKREIFDYAGFTEVCGERVNGKYSAYVAKSFFDTLYNSVSVEMKVLPYIADDAVQAGAEIMDSASTPVKIFDVKAGYKGKEDKSSFGNRIGYKVSRSENISFKLAQDSALNPTSLHLDNVDNLKAGHYVRVADGSKTGYSKVVSVSQSDKTITIEALTGTYLAADTSVFRLDWNLSVGVKIDGVFVQKEEFTDVPMMLSSTDGMCALVNDPVSGSKYVTVAVNMSNASAADKIRPADVTSWKALANGSDGTAPTDSDWNELSASFADEDVTIFLAPESSSVAHNGNMALFSTNGEKFMFYAQAPLGSDEDDLKNFGGSLRQPYSFAMLPCDKWIEVEDKNSGTGKKLVPPVGHSAAHYFNVYSLNGVSKVAAGNSLNVNTTDRLDESNGLIHNDRAGAGGRLIRNYSVNLARYVKGKGILINSARTFSTDDGYKYQNQVMGFILIKKSILEYLRKIEQDPSGLDAQESHYNEVYSFMKKFYDSGVFFEGQKEDGSKTTMADVVKIKNDFTVNTLANIANGIEVIFCQVVFRPPIEEPVLELASASVTTIRSA